MGYCEADPKSNTTKCHCAPGYFTKDCSKSIKDLRPGGWYTVRVLFAVIYFVLFAMSALALFFSSNNTDTGAFSFFNMKKVALGLLSVCTLDNFLYYIIDPKAFEGKAPYMLGAILANLIYPLTTILFGCIIFHWFEVYRRTVSTLKQEEMKQRINSKYQPNVTLESILSRLSLFNRIKLGFMAINIVFLAVDIAYSVIITLLYTSNVHSTDASKLEIAFYALFLFLYLTETIGFLIVGRKMVKLMPDRMARKMKRVTLNLQIQSILLDIAAVFLLPIYLIKADDVDVYLGVIWVISELIFIAIFTCMLSLFLKFSSHFPYFFSSTFTRSASSSANPQELHKSESNSVNNYDTPV